MSIRSVREKSVAPGELFFDEANFDRQDAGTARDFYVGNAGVQFGLTGLSGGTHDTTPATAVDYALGIAEGFDAEATAWLRTHPLQPIVNFYPDQGVVDIKMYKEERLTAQEFTSMILPYGPHKKTSVVEASFDGKGPNGETFLFTGIRQAPMGLYPTVTKVKRHNNNGHVKIEWELASLAEAKAFFANSENKTELAQVMIAQGMKQSTDEYLAEILANIPAMKTVHGYQEYDVNSGLYHYRQEVTFSNPATNYLVNRWFGSPKIENAALKVAYNTLREPGIAGTRGFKGTEVMARGDRKYTPGP